MRRRFLALTLALVGVFGLAGGASAHRLKASCRFLPGRVVVVDTWFDNGQTPKKGRVQVRAADGKVLLDGQLNRDGLYQFEAPEGQPLRVVVEAGDAHRAEVPIRPHEVITSPSPDTAATMKETAASAPVADPITPINHEEPFPIKDVLIGVGLLIAVAAFVMSLRNARSLREMRRSQHRDQGHAP
jgi:hypothetical protein